MKWADEALGPKQTCDHEFAKPTRSLLAILTFDTFGVSTHCVKCGEQFTVECGNYTYTIRDTHGRQM